MSLLNHPLTTALTTAAPSTRFDPPNQAADSARVVGSKGFWSVYLRCGEREWPLVLGQNMRVFRHFESVVVQLKNRGIAQFQVDINQDQAADKEVVISPIRPRVLKRASTAEAYDSWFRTQVSQSIETNLSPLTTQTVNALMAKFKKQLTASEGVDA